MAEEKAHNPRLGGQLSESDFAGYMANLKLTHPKKIDIAVPANLNCGQPGDRGNAMTDPQWAPLSCTFAGIWDIDTLAELSNIGTLFAFALVSLGVIVLRKKQPDRPRSFTRSGRPAHHSMSW